MFPVTILHAFQHMSNSSRQQITYDDQIVWKTNRFELNYIPKTCRSLVSIEQAVRRRSQDAQITPESIFFLDPIFYEKGMPHDAEDKIVLQFEIMYTMDGCASVPAVVHRNIALK